MKKIKLCLLAVGFMVVCVSAHAAGIQEYYAGKDTSSTKDFSDNIEIQWLLTNVSINGSDIGFSRDELSGNFNGNDFFTVDFSNLTNITNEPSLSISGNISGVGAPNRFSGPFTTDNKQMLEIKPLRTTLMASLFELDSLKEHDYFNYLQNAYKFRRVENGLEIYSKVEDKEVVLSFIDNFID